MGRTKGQPLICAENLSIPSFQVIVVDANMGCSLCRDRVFQLISKITGWKEFIVDVTRNQVIIKCRSQIPLQRPNVIMPNTRANKKTHTVLN